MYAYCECESEELVADPCFKKKNEEWRDDCQYKEFGLESGA